MPSLPHRLAASLARPATSAAPPISTAASLPASGMPDKIAPQSTRRRKLWEIPHKFHCPVIGACFDVAELRALMKKLMHIPHGTTDFVLHTTAVGNSETRTPLAEVLQKQLEKRYPQTIRRFAAVRDTAALRALWREATAAGSGIPGALWATWTHPACDTTLEHEVYADIHMIQHQIGSGTRADMKTLENLREENRELRRQLDKARQENEALRLERASENQRLNQRIAELRAELTGRDAAAAALTGQIEQLRAELPDLKDRQHLLRRASEAESRCLMQNARASSLEAEIGQLSQRLRYAEETMSDWLAQEDPGTLPASNDGQPCNPSGDLSGKCVLCVGGRAGAVDAYRQRVEHCGGRFIHHDGGLEESLHRIDGALSGADLVICQAGCISHNAYWRIKEQCKRTGKRCLFVRNAGLSSFERVINDACAELA